VWPLFSGHEEQKMNLLKKLLVAIASAGLMGSVQATTFEVGTLSPSVYQHTEFYSTSGFSFADLFNFTVGTEYRTVLASAGSYSPDGVNAEQTHVTNLTLQIFAGSDATGSILGAVSSSDGTTIDLSGVLAAGNYSAGVSGIADGQLGGGYQFSIAAVPEPAEWMMLLSGLVVVAFMARRKSRLLAG